MRPARPVLLAALLLPFLAFPRPLPNGCPDLAHDQFETARNAFDHQDYFHALRLLALVKGNAPLSAAPWQLSGHCLYLQGKDLPALFQYRRARDLNPAEFPLPKFAGSLLQKAAAKAMVHLSARDLFDLRRKIGQMIMVAVPGTVLSGQKQALLRAGWVGGVILFHGNVVSKDQVASYIENLQENSPTPLFVAVDQEGGAVRRFTEQEGFQRLPSLAALGRTKDPGLAYRFGLLSGQQLREVGANLNLAPVVDLDHGVQDSIITRFQRSLGGDPEEVAGMATEIIRGMRDEGVLATAKHFPSQSLTSRNTHRQTAVTDRPLAELSAEDMLPYRKLIGAGLLDALMLSHVVIKELDPYFPASLSPEVVQNILRGRMGYQGLVISDDLRMEAVKERFPLETAAVQAVNAGVDILLITDNMERRVMDALVAAVATGRVARSSVEEAYDRIMATKLKYGLLAKKATGDPKVKVLLNPASPSPGPGRQGPQVKASENPTPAPTKGQEARHVPNPQDEAQGSVAPIPSTGDGGPQGEARDLGVPSLPQRTGLGTSPSPGPGRQGPGPSASRGPAGLQVVQAP